MTTRVSTYSPARQAVTEGIPSLASSGRGSADGSARRRVSSAQPRLEPHDALTGLTCFLRVQRCEHGSSLLDAADVGQRLSERREGGRGDRCLSGKAADPLGRRRNLGEQREQILERLIGRGCLTQVRRNDLGGLGIDESKKIPKGRLIQWSRIRGWLSASGGAFSYSAA